MPTSTAIASPLATPLTTQSLPEQKGYPAAQRACLLSATTMNARGTRETQRERERTRGRDKQRSEPVYPACLGRHFLPNQYSTDKPTIERSGAARAHTHQKRLSLKPQRRPRHNTPHNPLGINRQATSLNGALDKTPPSANSLNPQARGNL